MNQQSKQSNAKGKAPAKPRNRRRYAKGKPNARVVPEKLTFESNFQQTYARYANQMMLPADHDAPVMQPVRNVTRGCSRRFVTDLEVDSSNFRDGKLRILVPSGIRGNVYMTESGASPSYPADWDSPGSGSWKMFSGGRQAFGPDSTEYLIYSDEVVANLHGLQIECSAPVTFIVLGGISDALEGASLVISYVDEATPTEWTILLDTPANSALDHQVTIPQTADFLSVLYLKEGEVLTGIPTEVSWENHMRIGGDGMVTVFQKGINFLQNQAVSEGKLSSMSLLITNTSAELEKQGTLYIGNVPVAVGIPKATDFTNLPDKQYYKGQSLKGGYTWWQASDVNALEIQTPANTALALKNCDNLHVFAFGLDVQSSFTVRVCWIVDFYSPKQVFEKRVPPAISDKYEAMYHFLRESNHACCNPDHSKLFKTLISKGLEAAKKTYSAYSEDPAFYNAIVRALAGVLVG